MVISGGRFSSVLRLKVRKRVYSESIAKRVKLVASALLVLIAASLSAGCGQKGKLFLPPPTHETTPEKNQSKS